MNKYDWKKVPKGFDWVATTSKGYAFAHRGKPISGWLGHGFWYGGGDSEFIYWPKENPFNGDWRESLEQRPEECK
jgi:hypothetical protein